MKSILMFIIKSCPYCKQALSWMQELKEENPGYSEISVTIIDENVNPEMANKYDYYLVPTYYIDETKVHEGIASKDIVRHVFDSARE